MTKQEVFDFLMMLGWDEIGAEEIANGLEEGELLQNVNKELLRKYSEGYIDR